MRLIDGDELIVKLYQDQPMDWTGSDAEVQELNDWELFRNMVDNAPTVDAKIVVRCKDCKYSYEEISYLCCSHGVCVDCEVPPNFYCAEGKRKEPDE